MLSWGMKSTQIRRFYLSVAVTLAFVILAGGCSSRYRMELYLTTDRETAKVKVEQARYIPGVVLEEQPTDEPVRSGDGSVIILNLGFRGSELTGFSKFGFGLDEYVKHNLYLQLPDIPQAATIQLREHSFLLLQQHYELSPETKVFRPISGTCQIDSVTSSAMFGTLEGSFENSDGASVDLSGRFRVKL